MLLIAIVSLIYVFLVNLPRASSMDFSLCVMVSIVTSVKVSNEPHIAVLLNCKQSNLSKKTNRHTDGVYFSGTQYKILTCSKNCRTNSCFYT